MRRFGPGAGDAVFSVSGNMQMFNANSLALAGELDGWPPLLWIPDTLDGRATRADHLTPTAVFEADAGRAHPGHRRCTTRPCSRPTPRWTGSPGRLGQAGWVTFETIPLPDGGEVQLLRHGVGG